MLTVSDLKSQVVSPVIASPMPKSFEQFVKIMEDNIKDIDSEFRIFIWCRPVTLHVSSNTGSSYNTSNVIDYSNENYYLIKNSDDYKYRQVRLYGDEYGGAEKTITYYDKVIFRINGTDYHITQNEENKNLLDVKTYYTGPARADISYSCEENTVLPNGKLKSIIFQQAPAIPLNEKGLEVEELANKLLFITLEYLSPRSCREIEIIQS